MRRQVWIAGIAAASQMLLGSGAAYAEIGVVAYYKSGCDYYIVSASQGYALLEWYGGDDPMEGDKLAGTLSYGMQTLVNLRTESDTQAWVEDFMLSEDDAINAYSEQCD